MNIDTRVVKDFGNEWAAFDQSTLSTDDQRRMFDAYFSVFPWHAITKDARGFDCGCGSGRWAALVAPRVGELHCIDPSEKALSVAKRNLSACGNVRFHQAGAADMPIADDSMDFGYSFGVLHHIPDTSQGIADCARKLKPGAPFALYLYYAFDNRPAWFRWLWKASDLLRRAISKAPFGLKRVATEIIAALVYWPLARTALLLESAGFNVAAFPLSIYRNLSFYAMRTDALDRFGTRLEQRFTKREIASMMEAAGFGDIRFSDQMPHWCASAIKRHE